MHQKIVTYPDDQDTNRVAEISEKAALAEKQALQPLIEVAGIKKKKSLTEWFLLGFVLLFSIGFYLSSAPKIIQEWLTQREASDLLIIAIIFSLYLVKTVALTLPIFFLYSLAGVFLDPLAAIVVSYAGLTLEMTVSYLIGRHLGRERVQAMLKKHNLNLSLLTSGDAKSFLACSLLRMIPGPPIDLVTYLYGASQMKYMHSWLTTLLGLSPALIPIVLMGVSWQDPFSAAFLIPMIFAAVVSLFSLLFFRYLGKKHVEK